ncbi:beta strand repeat-containing protein, partial [Sunxiuqinia sp. A32]|uniref:beta strand repeat-containing protein n=1 Tax=Sunxiuqinia sp. A32 TaxID=3461496 RepID=UPI0040467E04
MAMNKERFYVACVGAFMLLTFVSSGHAYNLTKPEASNRFVLHEEVISSTESFVENIHNEKSQQNRIPQNNESPLADNHLQLNKENILLSSTTMTPPPPSSFVTGDWDATGTWDNSTVPTSADNVIIANGHTVTIDIATAQCNSITIDAGGTLVITGTGTLDVTGDIINNGTLTANSGSNITVSGDWTNNATYTSGGGTVTFDTNGSSISGTNSFDNLVIDAGSDITSTIAINSTTNISHLQLDTGLLQINGGTTTITDLNSSTSHKILETAGLEVNVGGNLITGDFSITNEGLIRINNGSATFGNSTGNSIETQVDGAFFVNGGSVEIAGRLHNSASGTLGLTGITSGITIAGGMITLSTIGQGLSATGSLNITAAGNFSFSGGTIVFQTANSTGGTAMDLQFLTGGGTKSISDAATFQFGNSSTPAAYSSFVVNSQISIPNIEVNSNSSIELADFLDITNSFTFSGDVILNGNEIEIPVVSLGTYNIPLDDGSGNAIPVSIQLTGGNASSGSSVTISTTASKLTENKNTNNYLNRYWSVVANSITSPEFTFVGTYLTSDIAGTESEIAAGLWSGSYPWGKGADVNTSNKTLTYSGITSNNFEISGITSDPPTITIDNGNAVSICNGSSTTLTTTATGDPVLTYSWSSTPSGTNETTADITVSPAATTTYSVIVTDGNGFTATDDIEITVTPDNTIALSSAGGTDAQTVCINSPITNITYNTSGATGAT